MLIEFKITNFRSIKETQSISFLPSSRLKKRNSPLLKAEHYPDLYLLNSCVIYGGNNAGKSNTLKAFKALGFLIEHSHTFTPGDKLESHQAFGLDTGTLAMPTSFHIDFIASDNIRYDYQITFDTERVYDEQLYYYPNPKSSRLKASKLFIRSLDKVTYGPSFDASKQNIESGLTQNQLFVSKAVQYNVQQLNPLFEFFKKNLVLSIFHDREYDEIMLRNLGEFIYNKKHKDITSLVEKFIINSDTGIVGLEATPKDKVPTIQFPKGFPEEEKERIKKDFIERFQYEILTKHRLFENGKEIGVTTLPLKEQSTGTKKFFSMLRLVLFAIKDGAVLIVDELDKSLHTEWTQLIISLFKDPETNPNNAQLIFATHDTNLLGTELFNRDQIYMIEKNRFGASELTPLSAYTKLRDTTPFEKWYLEGRFGAVPNIYKNFLKGYLGKSPIFNE